MPVLVVAGPAALRGTEHADLGGSKGRGCMAQEAAATIVERIGSLDLTHRCISLERAEKVVGFG
jgi:hypothetical protein